MKKVFKKISLILFVVLLVLIIVAGIYLQPTKANLPEFETVKNNQNIELIDNQTEWIIRPKNLENRQESSDKNLIFYTGGLVEEKAYLYNLSKISEKTNYTVFVPKINFNLAVLDQQAAKKVVDKYNLQKFVLSGHSLGGVVACYNVNDLKPDGLILFGSYCDKPITNFRGKILSITGSKDGLIKLDQKQIKDTLLPKQAKFLEIQGMNHAQIGHYGNQKGDNPAEISNEEATNKLVEIVAQNI